MAGPTALAGPTSLVIVDGTSMEPTYLDGDLVVAYERDNYAIGDVIVYDAPVDTQFNVIHRIIERTDGGFITQGDNRDEPDGWIAPDGEIYGSAILHIPRGGKLVMLLRQPSTILAIGAGWITLILLRSREDDPLEEEQAKDDRSRADEEEVEPTGAWSARTANTPEAPAVAASRFAIRRRIDASHERASCRTQVVGMLAGIAVVGATLGVVLASAATLHVDGGVLQVLHPELPALQAPEDDRDEHHEEHEEEMADGDDSPADTSGEETAEGHTTSGAEGASRNDNTNDDTNDESAGPESTDETDVEETELQDLNEESEDTEGEGRVERGPDESGDNDAEEQQS